MSHWDHENPERNPEPFSRSMNDPTNANNQVPSLWGDDMESALIERDRLLRSQLEAASSPRVAQRIRAGLVFVICAAALLGFLLVFLISYACCNAITQ